MHFVKADIDTEFGCVILSHVMRKPVYDICKKQRCRSACVSAQSDQHLLDGISLLAVSKISRLASLCSWASRFEFYLVAKPQRQVFWWLGLYLDGLGHTTCTILLSYKIAKLQYCSWVGPSLWHIPKLFQRLFETWWELRNVSHKFQHRIQQFHNGVNLCNNLHLKTLVSKLREESRISETQTKMLFR